MKQAGGALICLLRTFTSMLSPKAQHSNPQARFEASGAARTTAAMGTVQGPARRPPPRSTSLDAQAVSALRLVKISPTSPNTAPTSWDASPPTKMLGGFGMSHSHLQWRSKGRIVSHSISIQIRREKKPMWVSSSSVWRTHVGVDVWSGKGHLQDSVKWVGERTESLLAQPEFLSLSWVQLSLPPEGCLPCSESTRKWRCLVQKKCQTLSNELPEISVWLQTLYFKTTLGILCEQSL